MSSFRDFSIWGPQSPEPHCTSLPPASPPLHIPTPRRALAPSHHPYNPPKVQAKRFTGPQFPHKVYPVASQAHTTFSPLDLVTHELWEGMLFQDITLPPDRDPYVQKSTAHRHGPISPSTANRSACFSQQARPCSGLIAMLSFLLHGHGKSSWNGHTSPPILRGTGKLSGRQLLVLAVICLRPCLLLDVFQTRAPSPMRPPACRAYLDSSVATEARAGFHSRTRG